MAYLFITQLIGKIVVVHAYSFTFGRDQMTAPLDALHFLNIGFVQRKSFHALER
jgi:hypothetical protein